jgi:hypothetical protein
MPRKQSVIKPKRPIKSAKASDGRTRGSPKKPKKPSP